MRFRTKSGQTLIFRSVVGPVHNQEGQIDRAISIHFDISEQMRLQSQLEQAQRLAKIGNWSYQFMSKQTEWSKQMYELFAVSTENGPPTLEQHLLNIHPEDRAQWHKTVQKTMATGEKYVLRYRSVFPDRILWIEAIGEGLYDRDGKLMALAGTCQDITEKVHSENLLEQQRLKTIHAAKLASLGEMSAGVAHEVNNPLASHQRYAPLIGRVPGESTRLYIEIGNARPRCFCELRKIVNGLRRFSRAAEGNILTPNRLSEIIADANIITDLKAKRFDVSVENQIESDALILCDPIEN